jgi:hypothetical protein
VAAGRAWVRAVHLAVAPGLARKHGERAKRPFTVLVMPRWRGGAHPIARPLCAVGDVTCDVQGVVVAGMVGEADEDRSVLYPRSGARPSR